MRSIVLVIALAACGTSEPPPPDAFAPATTCITGEDSATCPLGYDVNSYAVTGGDVECVHDQDGVFAMLDCPEPSCPPTEQHVLQPDGRTVACGR